MGDTTIRPSETLARSIRWIVACCGVFVAAGAGCSKKADPAECHKACERVARLQTAAKQKDIMTALHEQEERVESVEDQTKSEVARLKKELTTTTPRPDLSHAKLSSADRRKVAERVDYEAAQLKQQREQAIQAHEDALRTEQQSFADAKKRGTEEIKKALDGAIAACDAHCDQRSEAQVQCLLKTQALEDIATCERK